MQKKPLNIAWLLAITTLAVIVGLTMKQHYGTDWFEFAGFITGVVGVYLVAVEHIWNWPIGIVNVLVYAWVFFAVRLFADMTLMFFFLALQIHGWHSWLHGGQASASLPISKLVAREWQIVVGFVILGSAIYIPIITYFKGAAPVVDSVLTVISIAAQLLTNRKKLECWLLWILVDIFYIPLYLSRKLEATSLLYAIFLILAVSGYLNWRKLYSQQPGDPPSLKSYPRPPEVA